MDGDGWAEQSTNMSCVNGPYWPPRFVLLLEV